MNATIQIDGPWAKLTGAPEELLTECMSFLDPKRWHSRAFREKRWDGKVCLSMGCSFPAGHVDRVVEFLATKQYSARVLGRKHRIAMDLSRFGRDFLPGITMWDHQYEACKTFLTHHCGWGQIYTSGGKTEVYIAVAWYLWQECGYRTYVIVPRKGLAREMARRARAYYNGALEVGQFGDGEKTIGQFTVCTSQALLAFRKRVTHRKVRKADPALKDMIANFEVMFLDEAHHTSAATWYEVAMKAGALRRFGMSGTPLKMKEIEDMKFIGALGPELFHFSVQDGADAGLTNMPKIVVVMSDAASEPELPYVLRRRLNPFNVREVEWYKSFVPYIDWRDEDTDELHRGGYYLGVVASRQHNKAVVRAVEWLLDHGRRPLILCRRKAQWQLLADLMKARGLDFRALWGGTDTYERDMVKADLAEGRLDAILATGIFDEGEDLGGVGAVVLAEGVKAYTNAMQRVGRGLGKLRCPFDDLWVVDFIPTCHPTLIEHGLERVRAWESVGYEVVVVEDWPKGASVPKNLLPFERWEEVHV